MVTITLPSELEKAVAEEAVRNGTTAEFVTLDALRQRFLSQTETDASSRAVPRELLEKVEGFLGLQIGWNGYGASPPSPKAASLALSALGALHGTLAAPDRLAPSAVGGVGITYRRGNRKAYVECCNSGQIVLLVSDADAEQLQTCKIEPTAEGFFNLPNVIKEYLDGGLA